MDNISSQVVKGLVVKKQFSISPNKDSDKSKKFWLELTVDNVTVLDMAHGLLKSEVITVANTNRPKWDKLVAGTTFKKTFMKPLADVDPEEAMVLKLQAMSEKDRKAYLTELAKKVSPAK